MILHSKARLAEYEMPAEGCPKDFAGYKQDCEEASAKANPYAYFFIVGLSPWDVSKKEC